MPGENLLFPPQHKLELPPSMERAHGKGQSFSTALGEQGVRPVWGEYQPHEHVWEEDLLKTGHVLDRSAALEINNLAAVIANLPGMFQAVLSYYRLTDCKLPGSLEKLKKVF